MGDNKQPQTPTIVEAGIKEMHIKNGVSPNKAAARIRISELKEEEANSPRSTSTKSLTQTPISSEKSSQSPDMMKEDHEETVGGQVIIKTEPGHSPKLARTQSQKIVARPPPFFHSYEDKTEESKGHFRIIPGCLYSSKYIGSTEHAMECDCSEEWGKIIELFTLTMYSEPY